MNDDPRAALVQRLMQLQQTGDPRHVLEPAALHTAELLARQTGEDPATAELLGWFHLYRHLALPAGADSEAREAAIFYFVRAYGDIPPQVREALRVGEASAESTGAAQTASGQAVAAHQRALGDLRHAMASRDMGAVERATAVLQSTVGEIPPDDPHHWMALFNVGTALLELFKLRQRLDDVDAAVVNLRAAAEECGRSNAEELPEVLTRLGMAYRERFGAAEDPADLTSMVEAIRSAAAMTPPDSPDSPRRIGRYSRALGERFDHLGARDDIDAAIDAACQAVEASERIAPLDLDECVLMYGSLGTLLEDRFKRFGTLADLDEAISAFESALTLTLRRQPVSLSGDDFVMLSVAVGARLDRAGYSDNVSGPIETLVRGAQRLPEDDVDRAQPLSYLATTLWERYERTNDLHDLEAAISLARTVLDVLPTGHPARADAFATWTRDLQVRSERTEDRAHREEAVDASHTALAAIPAGRDASTIMFNLGLLLYRRFTDNGQIGDLDEAIALLMQVLTGVPETLHRSSVLDSLGNMLTARYEVTGVDADLDAGIGHLRAAADGTDTDDPSRPRILSNLAGPLEQRYRSHGQDADLELAGKCLQEALASPAVDPEFKPTLLHNLGTNQLMQFERHGHIADLSAAVDLLGQALNLTAGRRRAPFLATLATAHIARFDAIGALADLDLAIDHLEESLRLTPDGDPDLPMRLSNLGAAYRTRSVHTGAGTDIESAISRLRSAVLASPPDHVGLGSIFSNLGNTLKGRYRRTADPRDLDEAVSALENAVRATPPDSLELAKHRTNLVSALIDRAELEGDQRGFADHAVAEATQALSALPVGNPTRAGAEAALAIALESRFRHGGARSDLDLAIAHGSAAADALPADHPQRAVYLHNLGVAWMDATTHASQNRPDARDAGPQDDRFEPYRRAVAAFRAAAEVVTAGPASRCQSARAWGETAADMGAWSEAVTGFRTAIGHLPLVAGRELARGDQEHQLSRFGGLATEAAAASLESNDPEAALTLLEQGRGVLLAQALQVRTDLTELQRSAPDLAHRFTAIRDELDIGAAADPVQSATDAMVTSDHAIVRRRRLAEELNTVIDQIRLLDGFRTFLMPPTPAEIVTMTTDGPIVIINTGARRSDALIAQPDGIVPVALPDARLPEIIRRTQDFMIALEGNDWSSSRVMLDVLGWLWDAVAEPVLDTLERTGATRAQRQTHTATPSSRLWWLPTGPLAMMPLHAAGHHGRAAGSHGSTVLDRVVSSYAPTVGALRHARQARVDQRPDRALVVAIPDSPGSRTQARLEHAEEEAVQVATHLHSGQPPLVGPAASRAHVLAELPRSRWAHFACHALADPDSPSESFLGLYDDPLTVLDVAALRMDGAHLAYLSACDTARGNFRLLDESIHLTSAFQLAGFTHVVGTLWPIADDVAARFANDTYRAISDRPNDVARALHEATRKVRDSYPRNPRLWAAHVHVGP